MVTMVSLGAISCCWLRPGSASGPMGPFKGTKSNLGEGQWVGEAPTPCGGEKTAWVGGIYKTQPASA